MATLDTLVELAQPWAKFYSHSHAAQALLMFAHVGGMLWGGGMALAADRNVWRMRAASVEDRARLLERGLRGQARVQVEFHRIRGPQMVLEAFVGIDFPHGISFTT